MPSITGTPNPTRAAHIRQQKLYLDRDGNLVTALQPQPGWVRIAVKLTPRQPVPATRPTRLPCAA